MYSQIIDNQNKALLEKEQEIAELKDKLNNLASVAEVRLANWQKYEKENKELKELILKSITKHITDLAEWDCGALQIWKDSQGNKLVDIEWCDGVSAFNLDKVLNLIKEKGNITKSELVEYCL